MAIKFNTPRWQDLSILAIGLWLLVSPWLINYPNGQGIAWSESTCIAVAIMTISAFAVCLPNIWSEVGIFVIGCWMISSPLLAHQDIAAPDQRLHQIMMIDSVVTSVLLLALSSWVIFEDGRLRKLFRIGGAER